MIAGDGQEVREAKIYEKAFTVRLLLARFPRFSFGSGTATSCYHELQHERDAKGDQMDAVSRSKKLSNFKQHQHWSRFYDKFGGSRYRVYLDINQRSAANFFKLEVTTLTSNELLTANLLNRLAYGPTPDDLDRILNPTNGMAADAYIAEQLAPETIAETVSNSHTNIDIIGARFAGTTDVIQGNTNYAQIDDFRAWHIL